MSNALSTLLGENVGDGNGVWSGNMQGVDGSLYGIPCNARRVMKFNPIHKSVSHIGPDLGGGWKWRGGAMADNGVFYCIPYFSNRGILKIDTNTDTVTELDVDLLPEQGGYMWMSCDLALDGCIYFMPSGAHQILKLDPNDNDALSSVGDDLGNDFNKYMGTVVGIDGCVYGIPHRSKSIVKYDPKKDITSFVGEQAEKDFGCNGNGALGRDGCIYTVSYDGRVLEIDTANNSYCSVGYKIESNHVGQGWGDAILGIDGCIYWPPMNACSILKFDPHTDRTSLVGDDLGGSTSNKWSSGVLASNGTIYCFPVCANHVLSVNPWKEFSMTLKNNIKEHPQELGFLFQMNEEKNDVDALSQTIFDHAVVKFGQEKVLEVLEKYTKMRPIQDFCKESNLYSFMIVASYKESAVSAINHLLRRELSWVNYSCASTCLFEDTALTNKKRKYISE